MTAIATAAPATVQFTEEMLGHVTFGELDFARGAQPNRDGSAAFKFHLTIEVEDIEDFGSDPLRPATAKGWIECDALGGAPMGRHPGEGVVDAYGNVFGHPGLHIADGSVMPGPTGPNPSFTIAALADRFADQIIDPDRRAAEAAAS